MYRSREVRDNGHRVRRGGTDQQGSSQGCEYGTVDKAERSQDGASGTTVSHLELIGCNDSAVSSRIPHSCHGGAVLGGTIAGKCCKCMLQCPLVGEDLDRSHVISGG